MSCATPKSGPGNQSESGDQPTGSSETPKSGPGNRTWYPWILSPGTNPLGHPSSRIQPLRDFTHQKVGARVGQALLCVYRMFWARSQINSLILKSRLASTGSTFLTFWIQIICRPHRDVQKTLESCSKTNLPELVSGSRRQPPAASGSRRQPAEMGFGPRLEPTLPHEPGAKMT